MKVFRKVMGLSVVVVFIALVAVANVQNDRELERIAKENNFDAERTTAFKSCDRDMSGKSLDMGDITVSRVPEEICVCHSREMVAVFKNGEYSSHKNVVEYMDDKKNLKPLNSKHLKSPARAEGEFKRLAFSLVGCIAQYKQIVTRSSRK